MRQRSNYSLFATKTLTQGMSSFGFPSDLSDRIIAIHKWLRYMREGNPLNEATDAEFINDIFAKVLGYKSPFEPESRSWELEFTPTPTLGFFSESESNVVAEIFIDRMNSKVEPKHLTTEWLIVADYRFIRLYHRSKSMLFYQQFALEDLVSSFNCLKQFYFLMSRRTLLTGAAQSQEPSRIAKLLEESDQTETSIADNFYTRYQKIRLQLIKDFRYRLQHSNLEHDRININRDINIEAIAKAQKLLNRIIFIAFCEDNNFLPDGMLASAYRFNNPYSIQPIWGNYKAIFSWISQGNVKHLPAIFQFGGELFQQDEILDQFLFVGDELCRQIKELTKFDFNEEISDTVLTYILEEAVKDLLSLKDDSEKSSKRRRSRYPPKALSNHESIYWELRDYFDRQDIVDPDHVDPDISIDLNSELETSPEALDQNLETINRKREYLLLKRQKLVNLRVIDPKCGSGIGLVIALNFLLFEFEQIELEIARLDNDIHIFSRQEMIESIVKNNLYGCDPSPECIEITKLHLWLRTVQSLQPMLDLDRNIQLGDLKNCNFGFDLTDSLILN